MLKNIIRLIFVIVLPPLIVPLVITGLITLGVLPDPVANFIKNNALLLMIVFTALGVGPMIFSAVKKRLAKQGAPAEMPSQADV